MNEEQRRVIEGVGGLGGIEWRTDREWKKKKKRIGGVVRGRGEIVGGGGIVYREVECNWKKKEKI